MDKDLHVALGGIIEKVENLSKQIDSMQTEIISINKTLNKWKGASAILFMLGGAVFFVIDLILRWR